MRNLITKHLTLLICTTLTLFVGMSATALASSVPANALCHQGGSYTSKYNGTTYTTTESCVDYLNLSGRHFPKNLGSKTFKTVRNNKTVASITLHYRPAGHSALTGQYAFEPDATSKTSVNSVLANPEGQDLTRQSKNVWTVLTQQSNPNGSGKFTYLTYLVRVKTGWVDAVGPNVSGWTTSLKPTSVALKVAENVTGFNYER
jgi:hypothetical protein